jgi:hypothetical protein
MANTRWNNGDVQEADNLPRFALHIAGLTAGIGDGGKKILGIIFEPSDELLDLGLPPKFLATYGFDEASDLSRQIKEIIQMILQMN